MNAVENARQRTQRCVIVTGGYWLLFATVLFACGYSGFKESFFSADNLYLPALFEDLFRWSGRASDWRLTPAPYYFPDMLFYATVRTVAESIEWSQYLAGTLQLALFTAMASSLTGALRSSVSGPTLFVVPAMAALIAIHCYGGLPLLSCLVHTTQHGGATLITVVVLRLALMQARAGLEWAIVTGSCVLSILAGVSDPLFAASCCAAMLLLGLCAAVPVCWRYLGGPPSVERTAIRNRSLASACGGLVGSVSTERIQARFENLMGGRSTGDVRASMAAVLRDLTGDALSTAIWLGVGVLLCGLILFRFRAATDRHLRVFALWHIAAVAFTIPAIALYATYQNTGALRYFAVPYATTLIVYFCVVARALDRIGPSVARSLAFGAAVTLFGMVASTMIGISNLPNAQFTSAWHGEVRCVQAILEHEHTDTVLTDYWQAKPLMLFSHGKVKALQMRAKLRNVYHWINSRGWYRGSHNFGVVGVNDLQPDAIRGRYGNPTQIERCGNLELFVYRGTAAAKLSRDMNKLFARFTRR